MDRMSWAQKRITDAAREADSAAEKAVQSRNLFDRSRGGQGQQHIWMMQSADQEFNDAAGLGDQVTAALESVIDAMKNSSQRVLSSLEPLQALVKRSDHLAATE